MFFLNKKLRQYNKTIFAVITFIAVCAAGVIGLHNIARAANVPNPDTQNAQTTGNDNSTANNATAGNNGNGTGGSNSPLTAADYATVNRSYDTKNYVQTGNSWFTPTCIHGEQMIICLPLVNMSPYNLKDVIVVPKISGQDKEWPFEIMQTNITIPVGNLLGANAQPDINERTQNIFWPVVVREDVLNGYYRLDFEVLYTDELCYQGVSTISLYVDCIGKEGAGNKNSDEQLEASTPRIIITGYETDPDTVKAGQNFNLVIHIKNTSTETPVNNVQIDLTATESGKEANQVYATFLPTKGSNTAYFSSIPSGGTADIQMEFTAKSDLEQRPYEMKLTMKYENNKNKAFEGSGSISIPVKQQSRFEISTITASPNSINVGYDTNVMFSIYNTGKTTLYNVKADFIADSIGMSNAFVGNLSSGATGNIDCLITGLKPTTDDGTVIVRVSYEDESGNTFYEDYTTNILVTSLEAMTGLELMDMGDESARVEPEDKDTPKWVVSVLAGVGIAIFIAIIVVIIIKLKNNKKDIKTDIVDDDD